jgi:hypothetical protein
MTKTKFSAKRHPFLCRKQITMQLQKNRLRVIIVVVACILATTVYGQRKSKSTGTKELKIPFTADRWQFQQEKAEFVQHKNTQAMKLLPQAGQAVLKDFRFTNGTIEFDLEPVDPSTFFMGVSFRQKDPKEREYFYLRVGREDNHKRNDAIQYAPVLQGNLLWDMYPHYQGPAVIHNNDWNHVKLVISGKQMRVYVNSQTKPSLQIPYLEADASSGTLSFEGQAYFANLVVRPDIVEDLPPAAGVDLTDHDAHFIRKWAVTTPTSLPMGRELFYSDWPNEKTAWDSISAERNALINLSRKFGLSEERRVVWLKAVINSKSDLRTKLQLGFSDEVWVFINRQMVYVDKNIYPFQAMRKSPNGRISTENSSFLLPLKAGDNELLIGVSNDFYGWGIIARLETMEGIELKK